MGVLEEIVGTVNRATAACNGRAPFAICIQKELFEELESDMNSKFSVRVDETNILRFKELYVCGVSIGSVVS